MSAPASHPPPSLEDVAELLRWIPSRPNYETWVRVIGAVGSVLPDEQAESVLCAWSPEEKRGEYRAKLKHRITQVGYGTLVQMAKANGYTGRPMTAARRKVMPEKPAPPPVPPYWPEPTEAMFSEGREYLLARPDVLERIDTWRGWPAGTAATLAQDWHLSSPPENGQRGLAFAVHAPITDDLGMLGVREIGYHVRLKPPPGQRADWRFRPNRQQDADSIPALPFVMGAGFISGATHIAVCEGQWDAITLAAAAGWLASDAAWPERVALFGIRGASNWGKFVEYWVPRFPKACKVVMFPQADFQGQQWKAPGKFADTLREKHYIAVRCINLPHPDLNDRHRAQPITQEDVAQWLAP